MAGKDEKTKQTKPKKQSTIKQIITIFKYTHKEDKMLPALIAGAFLVPVIVFVILGIIFRWTVLTWVFLMLIAIMLGMLLSTIVLTRRADMVGYKQLDGKTGAAISVLRNINKAGFNFPEQPVWVDPRTKDAIWRGTGYNGIYLLGEGDYDRVKRAMDRQEQSIKSVTAGSQIPVYRVMVGNGQGQGPQHHPPQGVPPDAPQERSPGEDPPARAFHPHQGRAGETERPSAHTADQERHGHPQGHRSHAHAARQPPRDARPLIFGGQPHAEPASFIHRDSPRGTSPRGLSHIRPGPDRQPSDRPLLETRH